MTPLFADPRRRIARAKEHIDDLETGINDFLQSQPYTVFVEADSDTGNKTHKVKLTRPIPDTLLSQAIEITEGLRAALDKCGFAAAKASGNTRLKGTYFPIANTDQQLTTDVFGRGRCKDIPDDIVALFRGFQPYKTGNPPIWALNKLASRTKHRILVPIGMLVGDTFLQTFVNRGLTVEMAMPPRWDWENDEMILCVVGPNLEDDPQYEIRLQMQIEVCPVENLRLGPAPHAFRTIAGEVERILMATEAETSRLFGSAP